MPRALILVLLAAGGLNAQSLANEINRGLPAWLRFGGEYRARLESMRGIGFADAEDTHLLNRVRLSLGARPVSWLKFALEGQDSRIWGNERLASAPPYRNALDLRVAYLELGDSDGKTFGVRAGRQELQFGEQRLVGNTNWSNTARTFDAIRATVNLRGWRVDAFASSVVPIRDGVFDRPGTGNNFHGIHGSTESLVAGSTIQAYSFWRLAAGTDFRTWGTRWAGKLPARFDYGVEMAAQEGTSARLPMRAWAGHWQIGRALPGALHPRLIAEYNYASGDKGDGTRRTFDTLYPTPHGKYGLTDQVGWRNMHGIRLGAEMKPRPAWTVNANWRRWWRASARDGLYNAGGTLIVPARNIAATSIGQEIECDVLWAVTKQTQIGAGLGHLFPGAFLKQATPGRGYTYPYLMLNYTF